MASWTTIDPCRARSRRFPTFRGDPPRGPRRRTTSAARRRSPTPSCSRRQPRPGISAGTLPLAAHGYDGFLRWAYDAWAADPVRDARHVLWPAGDTFLVYPGSQSSIRFERLREGIVDFEKIRLLRSWASSSTDRDVKRLASDLEQALSAVASDRAFDEAPLRANLAKGTRALVALSDQLTR